MGKKISIIVIGTRGFPNIPGGIENHCAELYPRLAKHGFNITVLARKPYAGAVPYTYKGVFVLPLPCPKHKFFETPLHTLLALFKAKQLRATIVHIHAVGPALFAPLARLLGLTVIMTHHGPDYERAKWNWFAKAVLKIGEHCGLIWAQTIITVSQHIKHTIRVRTKQPVTAIPNGVVIRTPRKTTRALTRFGITSGAYVLSVGRFVPEKGFHDLIAAWNAGAGKLPPHWKLVLVGDADHPDTYSQALKKQARTTKNVILSGFLCGTPLEELFSHAGLFVLASRHEGLPIVLLEALSYGIPCLSSDIAANQEIGQNLVRYFTAGCRHSLEQQLTRILNQQPAENLRRRQIAMLQNRFNWDTIAELTVQQYNHLTAKKSNQGLRVPAVKRQTARTFEHAMAIG